MGRQRTLSVIVVTANAAGAVVYLAQGRVGVPILLLAVALLVAWVAFRPPSTSSTFRPVRTLSLGLAFFAALTLLLLLALTGADTGSERALGGISAAVAAGFTGVAVWALLRARRMGLGWSTEVEKRQRPDDNPSARR